MLASLSQFSEYQQLQPGLYGKRRGYHQLPVVNSSGLEQDVTDQHKTKTIRFRSTDVKLSLGSLSNNERQQPEREKINRVIKQKQYICACLVSISCTGIKQTCIVTPGSVQLFNNNLTKESFSTVSSWLFCVRQFVLLCYKQTTTSIACEQALDSAVTSRSRAYSQVEIIRFPL